MATCDICGEESNEIYRTNVEGSIINTCKKCSKYGKVIEKVIAKKEKVKKKEIEQKPAKTEIELIVVPNYSEIVKSLREKLGLSQEDFAKKVSEKLSVIKHIEHGTLEPSIKLAQKLERMFGVKLLQEIETAKTTISIKEKPTELTLGEVVQIKTRKKK